ncbi:putative opsin [Bimuria novae-zelandiae CBS 107.79]|uniref:Putative opsin n=1 Tax=Bimuria novae-zelandiae CBS 107.79 TaxID=1447943 RepID=A0A6A5VE87_9PLEO|nr:putative opsin [Bimuria novae-zelandiae CBS 107.79]
MMIDPVDALKTKSVLPIPLPTSLLSSLTAAPTASATPLPSVIPDPIEEQFVGDNGKKTLWVIFVAMVITSVAFAAMSWRVPIQRRLYHFITTLILIFASISYFAMATGHGVSVHKTIVRHQNDHVPDTTTEIHRQVFWARYVDWALTTPLLLLDLSLLAGLNGAHTLMAIVADVIMILTGLFAAFGSEGTPQKWGWYAISCFAYLVVIWHLAVNGRATASARSQKVGKFFLAIAGYTLILWTAYPIVWGIADGSRNLSVDGEIIAYAVLDVLAKPVFGIWLLVTHARIPETNIELGGFWSYGLGSEGAVRLEDDGA